MTGSLKISRIQDSLIINMNPLVITSVYHGTTPSEFLDFWQSLASQSFQNFTLCLYMDGYISSMLESCIHTCIKSSTFPVEIITSTSNMGLAKALNAMVVWGLCNKFNVFIRADSDDCFPPQRFQLLTDFLAANSDIDAVGSNYRYFGIRQGNSNLPCSNHLIKHKFCYSVAVGHATVAFRDSFFSKAGFYEQGFNNKIEDQRLWAAAFRNNCVIANLKEVLYDVRVTPKMLFRRASFSEKSELLIIRLRHIVTQIKPISIPALCVAAIGSYLISIILILFSIPVKIYASLESFASESDYN